MIFNVFITVAVTFAAAQAIRIPLKTIGSQAAYPRSTPTANANVNKGTIQVYSAAGTNLGCLLGNGHLSLQTCATFLSLSGSSTPGTTVFKSRKGLCSVETTDSSVLSCGSDVVIGSAFTESPTSAGLLISYGLSGSSDFSVDDFPTDKQQVEVHVGSNHSKAITLVYVAQK